MHCSWFPMLNLDVRQIRKMTAWPDLDLLLIELPFLIAFLNIIF
jgi:Mrp family chromosome partitioning ATPase